MTVEDQIVRTEATANCEQHGSYPATIRTMTVGDKTHTSTSLCPTCNAEQRRIQERRLRGFDETQNTVICERHGEYTAITKTYFRSDGSPSFTVTSLCPDCEQEREERLEEQRRKQEQESREEQRRVRIERNRKAAEIPTRFTSCTFENYVAHNEGQRRALEVAKGFATHFDAVREAGSSLTFCGGTGTGKTHLACAIAVYLLAAGYSVIYTQVIELIRAIRDTWRRDAGETESAIVSKFRNVGLLILDEVGVQFGSEAEKNQLFDVIDGRYRDGRPTLIISNLNGRALRECLGERLFDRMTEVGSDVVPFDWKSSRRDGQPNRRLGPAEPSSSAMLKPTSSQMPSVAATNEATERGEM